MQDFLLIIDWWVNTIVSVWNVASQYWFIVVPVALVLIGNILSVIHSIEPSNKNR